MWNYVVAQDNQYYWGRIKSKAESDNVDDDYGQWRALAYQMTGNAAYAQSAMVKVRQVFVDALTNNNFIRDKFVQTAWCYDFLYPGLTPAERTEFMTGLKGWAANTINGSRMGDTDENTGRFFGLAMLDQLTAAEGKPTNYLDGNYNDIDQGTLPVGGLDPDANPAPVTWRKWAHHLAQMASGGEWVEGEGYNLNTDMYWLVGMESLKTATGAEHFPEYRALVDPVARRFLTGQTSDGLPVQYLDVETPVRVNRQPRTLNCFGSFGAMTSDTVIAGGLQDLVNWMFQTADNLPDAVFYLFNDPRSGSQDWHTAAPLVHFADGQNVLFFHTGYQPDDTLFTVQMFPPNFVDENPPSNAPIDHYPSFFSDFQVHRKGSWVVDHPLGYGSSSYPEATNTMLIEGLGMAINVRQRVAYEESPGAYAYIAGLNSGWPTYSNFPDPAYLTEWTRSMVYLPSSDKQSDTVVIYDRINSKDMRTMPSYADYYYNDVHGVEEAIAAKPATRSRREWIIHTPVSPAVSQPAGEPQQVQWSDPSGQTGRVTTLVPTNPRTQVYDESQLWSNVGNDSILLTERKWQARVMPPTDQDWQTMLNVVQAYDNKFAPDNTLVKSADGLVEGALVKRAGLDDVLVLFSANPAQRLLEGGYTVFWTAGGTTQLFLPDLDPSLTWTASVDRVAAQPLPVSDQGMGRLPVAGAGAHTVVLAATAAVPHIGD